MPDHLQQIAAPAPEAEQMTAQRITLQHLLHQECEAGEALPHVGMARGKPHPHPGRQRDHRARPPDNAATAAGNVAASAPPPHKPSPPRLKLGGIDRSRDPKLHSAYKCDLDRPASPSTSCPCRLLRRNRDCRKLHRALLLRRPPSPQ